MKSLFLTFSFKNYWRIPPRIILPLQDRPFFSTVLLFSGLALPPNIPPLSPERIRQLNLTFFSPAGAPFPVFLATHCKHGCPPFPSFFSSHRRQKLPLGPLCSSRSGSSFFPLLYQKPFSTPLDRWFFSPDEVPPFIVLYASTGPPSLLRCPSQFLPPPLS